MKNYVFRYFLFLLPHLMGCNGGKESNTPTKADDSLKLTNIRLTELNGSTININQYKGKTVFINFWATWCKPCIEEMPSIRNLMEKMKDENIEFLFASDETPEQINRFRERTGFDFPFVRVENLEELNIMALPTTLIFTANGKLAYSEMGFRKWDDKTSIKQIQNIISSK